jgi:SnoaL-like domain
MSKESTDKSRRSLFWKLGAGVSAALASTSVLARAGTEDAGSEEIALRKLHQAYERAMDKGLYDEVMGMFADDAEVVFSGAAFHRRSEGVSRLYREQFRAGKTGKRMEPAPGFELDAGQQQDRVEVSPDRLSAKAVFPYSIQVGMPIESESSLASMARLHGEGVRTWWEGGVYDVSYIKDADGRWKIGRREYRTLSRADYRAGRSYARPISV